MTNARELLPCPFCGHNSIVEIVSTTAVPNPHKLMCGKCGAFGPSAQTPAIARHLWNTRQVTQLEAQLAEMREGLRDAEGLLAARGIDFDNPARKRLRALLTQSTEPK